jgi:hypothetical protein
MVAGQEVAKILSNAYSQRMQTAHRPGNGQTRLTARPAASWRYPLRRQQRTKILIPFLAKPKSNCYLLSNLKI